MPPSLRPHASSADERAQLPLDRPALDWSLTWQEDEALRQKVEPLLLLSMLGPQARGLCSGCGAVMMPG